MLETLRNAWKIKDLRDKILFTFFIILIYRIGGAITVPLINPEILGGAALFQSGSSFDLLNAMSGGALASGSIFALSISPYITSSIVVQLLAVAIPALEALQKEGPEGRKKLNKITRYVTIGLTLMQAIAYYLINRNLGAVRTEIFGGAFAAIFIVASFTAGSLLCVWLGEQIDVRGIGNGISMIIFAGIISRAPQALFIIVEYWKIAMKGYTQFYFIVPLVAVVFLAVIVGIIIMTNAERRIPIQYAKRVVGRKMYGGNSTFFPIKVTMSGVMPVIFSTSILSIPTLISGFAKADGVLKKVLDSLKSDTILYAVLYVLLVIAFNYFYIAIQYDPVSIANDLRKNSGTIPGIRPGKPTADFIAKVISKITLVGGLFLAAIAVLPIVMGKVTGMPLSLGGTSIIIVVGVALDTVRALESQMLMRHHKGFLE